MGKTTIDCLVCGCLNGVAHLPGCLLGEAEQIATTAATAAPTGAGRPRLLRALDALHEAGLLHDPRPADLLEDLHCLLDTLWEMSLIDRTPPGQPVREAVPGG